MAKNHENDEQFLIGKPAQPALEPGVKTPVVQQRKNFLTVTDGIGEMTIDLDNVAAMAYIPMNGLLVMFKVPMPAWQGRMSHEEANHVRDVWINYKLNQ